MSNDNINSKTYTYVNKMSLGLRLFLFVFGLFPLSAPYELLIKPKINPFLFPSFFFLIISIISIGAVVLSLLFIIGAILGREEVVSFVEYDKIIIYKYSNLFSRNRTSTYNFNDIEKLYIDYRDFDGDPKIYFISIKINKLLSEIHIGKYASFELAEVELNRIKSLIEQ